MSHTRLIDRSGEAIRDRYRTFFENAFMPDVRHEQMPGADERVPCRPLRSTMRQYARQFRAWAMVALLTMVAIRGVAVAGPLEDAEAAHGRGDYVTALPLFRLLADQGDATAQYRLGHLYDAGSGVTQNYAQAVRWYRLAADQGLAAAQFDLATMYENGQSVPQDFVLAHMWFNLSASRGNQAAAFNRDELATSMNPAQITEAQKLARGWKPKSQP
jgi:hypothetical protein